MRILGISCYYHDSAAALVVDGTIVAAAQEERFTRKKHDSEFPARAIEYCLSEGNITIAEIDHVVFYDKPFLKFERILENSLAVAPFGFRQYLLAIPVWLKKKLWIPTVLKQELGWEGEVLFSEHHEAHAASAFYPSPFQEAAVLTIDGVGEWATASWSIGENNQLTMQEEIHYPHSLGLLYSAFTYYTGFKVNSGEYKVMGLAPYGTPKYRDLIFKHLIDVKDDGSFRLDMSYFNFHQGLTMTSKKFHDLFGGEPRKPESELTQKEMDLAASVQVVTEEIIIKLARSIQEKSKMRNLCLAGGVALNCVANGKILKENIFEHVWIQPAAGDAGGALGAALAVWFKYLQNNRTADGHNDAQRASLLGPSFSQNEIELFLTQNAIPFSSGTEDDINTTIARFLEEGKVVGLFRGRMEFGPRALGNRSIIGDPRNEHMQSTMNLKIKFRESFRPFAPAVLEDYTEEYFDIQTPSPYMLFTADVQHNRRKAMTADQENLWGIAKLNISRSDIPAVTHIDYSARLQTVSKKHHPRFHAVIDAFRARTGCAVVVNTSFNVRGEPIVCTPEDAYRCFMRTEMDVLILENCVLLKDQQPQWNDDEKWKDTYELD